MVFGGVKLHTIVLRLTFELDFIWFLLSNDLLLLSESIEEEYGCLFALLMYSSLRDLSFLLLCENLGAYKFYLIFKKAYL